MAYIARISEDTPIYIHPIARELLQACHKIIDIGCGIGRLASIFPDSKLIGVDVLPEASICLQRGYSEFYRIDLEKESLPGLNASGIICSHVLEHFLRPEKALSHMITGLGPGALFYAVCPTLFNAHYWDDYTHVRPFTENSIRGLLMDGGIENIQILYEFQAPFRGAGRLIRLWTRGNRKREANLAMRFPRLRARANVRALGVYAWAG